MSSTTIPPVPILLKPPARINKSITPDPTQRILSRLDDVKRVGNQWQAKCPAHEDNKASLSVSRGDDGRALLHCFAGCSAKDICGALGITEADLFAGKNGYQVRPEIIATYDYHNDGGELLYQVVRYAPKDFRQRRPDERGGWAWNMDGVRRVLYRLPQLIAADSSALVFIVEGEKDVDALVRVGGIATCNVGGAGKWRDDYAAYLKGRRVAVIADKDGPEKKHAGQRHACAVCTSLHGIAAEVKYLELPGEKVKDASDWFAGGGTVETLIELAEQAAAFDPKAAPNPQQAGTAEEARDEPPIPDAEPWPQTATPQAYYGLAGEIVRLIEPHTEADPVALLIQFLVAFGNVIGRGAWFVADGATHHLNLFAVLVGETAKGRKGTSWQQILRLYVTVAAQWAAERILSGLSSGEGLIWAVRDAIWKREPIKAKGGRVEDYQDVQVDPGIDDKRLLAMEGEFATPLKSVERDGCTLSPVIRNAWDTGNLRTLTKNSPAVATGAHVSILGHITRDELRRLMNATETGNGFANRFLWACVRRSKVLPEGGAIETVDFSEPMGRLNAAIQFGQKAGELKRDEAARALWHRVYPELSEGKPGMFGAVTSRAEAQVMRLAGIYALLDCTATIRVEHLEAALSLWRYCAASARYIFGTSLGDRLADEILSALRSAPAGMTRTEIRDLFNRNKSASQIASALGLLLHARLVRREPVPTGGRPSERWFYAGGATTETT